MAEEPEKKTKKEKKERYELKEVVTGTALSLIDNETETTLNQDQTTLKILNDLDEIKKAVC